MKCKSVLPRARNKSSAQEIEKEGFHAKQASEPGTAGKKKMNFLDCL
jgi:hypothetical protein